jgi:hypothetical protein
MGPMRWPRSNPGQLLALTVVLLGLGAHATARRFDMVTDAATNSEGELELEGWLDFGRPTAPDKANPNLTNVMAWLGMRVGLLDSLELASFLVIEKKNSPGAISMDEAGALTAPEDQSGLMQWVAELRWRPVEVGAWPVDVFVQFQLIHWFDQRPLQFRFTGGVSKHLGPVLLAANFSYWDSLRVTINSKSVEWQWVDASAGASVKLRDADGPLPAVSVGAEFWGLIRVFEQRVRNNLLEDGGMVVGPTASISRGRLWLTGHLGIPVLTPHYTDRSGSPAFFSPSRPLVGRLMLGINL